MSETQLERSVLEAKEREELFAIADALGAKPGARAKKADLVSQILRATGIEPDTTGDAGEKPRRTRARKAAADAAPAAANTDAAADAAVTDATAGSAAAAASGARAPDAATGVSGPGPTGRDNVAPTAAAVPKESGTNGDRPSSARPSSVVSDF